MRIHILILGFKGLTYTCNCLGVDKVPSLFAIKNRNGNGQRNGNNATGVCVPYSFQNYGSICCFGFPLNEIDEEMEGVEPIASPQMSCGVCLSCIHFGGRNECVTNKPHRTSAGRL